MEERQREVDDNWKRFEEREGALRFATIEPELPPLPESKPIPYTGPHPDDWEGWLERRKQIESEEKRAFNERFGYTQ